MKVKFLLTYFVIFFSIVATSAAQEVETIKVMHSSALAEARETGQGREYFCLVASSFTSRPETTYLSLRPIDTKRKHIRYPLTLILPKGAKLKSKKIRYKFDSSQTKNWKMKKLKNNVLFSDLPAGFMSQMLNSHNLWVEVDLGQPEKKVYQFELARFDIIFRYYRDLANQKRIQQK